MKRESTVGRLLALVLSVVLVASMFPMLGSGGTAKAAVAADKTVAGLSTSAIKAPKAPSSENDAWTGSYVWYGKYNGTPVLYRVLAPKTTIYGGSTMLLDCDSVLYYAPFDADGVANSGAQNPNEWKYSDVRSGLNGDAFFTKTNGFTTIEKNAIAKSTIVSHTLVGGTEAGQVSSWTKDVYVNYVALSGEKIFLLDGEDVSNSLYGYYYDDNSVTGKVKKKPSDSLYLWWLRSERDGRADRAGCVNAGGALDSHTVNTDGGVSPAFNINLSSVIFTSVITGTAGQDNAEYKLTLADSNLTVGVTGGQNGTVSGNKMTIPYTVSGADASKTTRVSVLILDKEYRAGNTNDAKILYYGNFGVLSLRGTCGFTFPAGFDMDDWGSSYYVYLLAEIENGMHETDYASVPVKLTKSGSKVTSLTITTQPSSTTAYVGDKASFSVEAAGYGTLKYQWQYRKNSSSSWADSTQSGNKTKKLTISTTVNHNGYQYRCVVTDSYNGKAISNAVTLTMKPKITTQPASVSVKVGDTATFTVGADGKATLKYQWQAKAPGSSTWTDSKQSGAKTKTLKVSTTVNHNGYQYRCAVTDGNGKVSYSTAATLTINPKITTQPVSKSVTAGTKVTFEVAATGKATLKYQWQYKAPGSSTWTDSAQSGAKTAKLTINTTKNHNNYQYRCVVTDGNNKKTISNDVKLTVK